MSFVTVSIRYWLKMYNLQLPDSFILEVKIGSLLCEMQKETGDDKPTGGFYFHGDTSNPGCLFSLWDKAIQNGTY
jgi:hypothetical protein